jgi:hypothetical protein
MRKSVAHQAELGFQSYLTGNSVGTVLQPCTGYAAHQVIANPLDGLGNPAGFATLTPPFVVFTGSKPKQLGYDSGLYELTLTARLETQIDDDMSTPDVDVHAARMEALRDLLEDFDAVFQWMNFGTTSSPVPCFGVSALMFNDDGERLMNEDRRLIAEFDYYLCATVNAS